MLVEDTHPLIHQTRKPVLRQNSFPEVDIQDNEFVPQFWLCWEGAVRPDMDEVCEVELVPFEDLQQRLREDPDSFTPWALEEFEYFFRRVVPHLSGDCRSLDEEFQLDCEEDVQTY